MSDGNGSISLDEAHDAVEPEGPEVAAALAGPRSASSPVATILRRWLHQVRLDDMIGSGAGGD